jgi:uncharacterized protein (DUF58 family)
MTSFGISALLAGIGALVLGLWLDWLSLDLVGIGLLAAVAVAVLVVVRPSRLVVDREIQPPRVPKGSPAIALLIFANRGRRSLPVTVATQPFAGKQVRTLIPALRRGERGTRAYRLPTTRRGIFDVAPVQVPRRDWFEFFRVTRHFGHVERIWVYPRILGLRRLRSGQLNHLEGPSSDISPQGSVTFHRLRDYVPGDDLRLVHWRSSARTGTLVVRHNVDTSQPYTVVILDLRPNRYTEELFEEAIDITASVVMSSAADKAPVQLRLTDGAALGGSRLRDPTPLIDHLTGVSANPEGSLQAQLLLERRGRGGTSLIVVTGVLDVEDLAAMATLRRRFDQLVLISVDGEGPRPLHFPGVRVLVGRTADEVAEAWNLVGTYR